jgi:hypothetical protein
LDAVKNNGRLRCRTITGRRICCVHSRRRIIATRKNEDNANSDTCEERDK